VPVAGSGTWRWDGAGSARVDLGPARLDALDVIPARLAITGVVRGRAEIETRGGAAMISATMRGDGLTVAGTRLGEATLQARLRGRDLEADLSLPGPGIAVAAAGRLAPGGAIVTRVRAHDVDVTGLAGQHLPPWASGVVGRLSAVGELTVPVDRPAAAEGMLRIEPPRLTLAGEEWRARGPIVVRRRVGVTAVERLEVESRLGTVTAWATVRDDGGVEGSLQGRMPLEIVPAMRPEIREAAGIVELDARLAGTLADPRIVADGVIRDGRVVLRDYPDSIRDIRARFSVSPTSLTLAEASASLGGGEVTARGDLALEQGAMRSYRFVVTGRRVAVTTVADLQTLWDADLEIAAVGTQALLRGEARLVRGLYSRDISVLKTLLERRAPQAGPAPGGVALDVRCALQDNLVVRTNLARFRARGTLTIQGTTSAPAVFGAVEGHSGEILFRKQAFRIVSALARFDDPRRIDPILDVRGVARIRDHEVRLSVRGRAEDLEIRFASSPALPEQDVLALVAFGKTRAELARGGGGAALGEAAGYLVAELLGVDTGRLGLDVLEVESTPEKGRRAGTREDPGRELRVGKRIAPGTTVVYAQGIEEWSRQALRIEYEVIGPLVVAAEQDFRRGFGGDVLLRLRFR
jgi:autotransporter translocation and assembly factor TamB